MILKDERARGETNNSLKPFLRIVLFFCTTPPSPQLRKFQYLTIMKVKVYIVPCEPQALKWGSELQGGTLFGEIMFKCSAGWWADMIPQLPCCPGMEQEIVRKLITKPDI